MLTIPSSPLSVTVDLGEIAYAFYGNGAAEFESRRDARVIVAVLEAALETTNDWLSRDPILERLMTRSTS